MVERICPVCKYTDSSTDYTDTKFIKLETMQCENNTFGCSTRLYACPKCGTVGIDVEDR